MFPPRRERIRTRIETEPHRRHYTHPILIRRFEDVVPHVRRLVGAFRVDSDVSSVVVGSHLGKVGFHCGERGAVVEAVSGEEGITLVMVDFTSYAMLREGRAYPYVKPKKPEMKER